MSRHAALAALCAVALAAPACSPASTAPANHIGQGAVRTGVTTHFSQGWPPRLIASAAGLGTATIRDSLHWAQVEQSPGTYTFTPQNSGHIESACRAGMTVLLGIEPRNRIYDGGTTAYTPATQAAFARYVAAIANRWPDCVVAIEIGNEINGQNNVTGPAATDRIGAHIALLRAVHDAVKPAHPGLLLLGGSTNTIATGFLTRLLRAGMLDWVDGLAVHPYRPEPEGVDWEVARLQAAMATAGAVKPIWATEFSREFPDPAAAAPFYLKMIALLESSGVTDHFWYALIDQRFFPTMGLLTQTGERKPAAAAYAFAARTLAPHGPAQRVDEHDPALYHFRFGADAHLIWGAPRALTVTGPAKAFAADGTALPAVPAAVSDAPVVITGASSLTFGPREVLADSLYGYARPPLAWFGQRPGGAPVPLAPIDWQWSSYLGAPAMPAISVNPAGIGVSPAAGTTVRFTADAASPVVASVCLRPKSPGMRALAVLRRNGSELARAEAGTDGPVTTLTARSQIAQGDTVELALMPLPGAPLSRFTYRFRVARGGEGVTGC